MADPAHLETGQGHWRKPGGQSGDRRGDGRIVKPRPEVKGRLQGRMGSIVPRLGGDRAQRRGGKAGQGRLGQRLAAIGIAA